MTVLTISNSVRFMDFEFFPYQRRLERKGAGVHLTSRALDLLRVLISRPGEVVDKQELLDRVWPHAVVDESAIRFQIVALRRALGDSVGDSGPRVIVTVPGRGYCFVGAGYSFVAAAPEGADPARAASQDSALRTRLAASGWIVGRQGDGRRRHLHRPRRP
jgi:DNA-binding winged helix-turn-helix (wHTH) protein